MTEFFDLGIYKSAASIVQRYGDAAPEKVAAAAVELLEARDFDGYVALKQILKDVDKFLNEGETAREQAKAGHV